MKTKLLKACVLALSVALNVEATPVMDLESMNKATIVQDVKANPSTLLEDNSFSKYGEKELVELGLNVGLCLKNIMNAKVYDDKEKVEESADYALQLLEGLDENLLDKLTADDQHSNIHGFTINAEGLGNLIQEVEKKMAADNLYDTVSYLFVLRQLSAARNAEGQEETFIEGFTDANSWNFTWLQRFISKGLMSSVTFEDLDSNSAPKDE